jgi:hypothetical protein
MSFSPSGLCVVAPTGQTCSQGAFSQWLHIVGWAMLAGSSASLPVK